MEKENIWELCPCGEGLINRSDFSLKEIPAGGKTVFCLVCRNPIWVPVNESGNISFVVVSLGLLLPTDTMKNINGPQEEFWDAFEQKLQEITKE